MTKVAELPPIQGIHHIKIAVSDLKRSLSFYEVFLGAKRIPEADHKRESDGLVYGHILNVPNLGTKVELRLNAEQAEKNRFFDPVTIAVRDRRALEKWKAYLEERELPHSPIIVAIQAWLVVVEDPDQNRIRLYSLETHGADLKPSSNERWLQDQP